MEQQPQFAADATLNEIRGLIVKGFNQVLIELRETNKNINLVRGDISNLSEKVKRIEAELNKE